jgi:hypothetical protein
MGLINPYNGLLINGGNMASAVGLVDGAAGAPSLYFNNSATTGLYRIGADILGIATAGAEKLRINATGQVTIRSSSTYGILFNGPALTAVAGVGYVIGITPGAILTASANADILCGVSANPAFNDGAFINVVHRAFQSAIAGLPSYFAGPVQIDFNTGLTLLNHVNGAAAGVGTLTNAPAAGNPTFWLPITINALGTKYVPCW